jgi:hypothetical protein
MSNFSSEKQLLQTLAKKVSEISKLPIQEKTLKEWKGLNSLSPIRPMFMIDQLPWGELNRDGHMDLVCEDPLLRDFERQLRETLYRWEFIQDDRVVENIITVPKAVIPEGEDFSGFGLNPVLDVIPQSEGTGVNSMHYNDLLKTEDDIEKIKYAVISEDKEESRRRFEVAGDIFGDIMSLRYSSVCADYGHVWDILTMWRGVGACMYDIVDRPEFTHKLIAKLFDCFHDRLDQYEKLGLIEAGKPVIHCTGAYCDELPGFNNESQEELDKYCHSAKNIWTMAAAQLFSMVSPKMHDEFEIEYQKKWYARFGLGYYGCCEPLDMKIDVISKLPNVRKISMSTWVNLERGSEAMNGRYVFSRKPNPAFLSSDTAWDSESVRKDLADTCTIAAKYGNPCELILKDVSTTGNKPERLWEWAKIASQVCGR